MTINKFCWFFNFSIKLFSFFTIIYLAFSFPIKAHHKIDNPTIKFSESPEIRNFFFEWRGHINLPKPIAIKVEKIPAIITLKFTFENFI